VPEVVQDYVYFSDRYLTLQKNFPDLEQTLSVDSWVVHFLDKECFSEVFDGTLRIVCALCPEAQLQEVLLLENLDWVVVGVWSQVYVLSVGNYFELAGADVLNFLFGFVELISSLDWLVEH
jgi:hypothetical protein